MAKAPKLYTRLTRNVAGVGTYSSLWLAADHLMIVRSSGYNEEYARMQFRDIKAIFLTSSNRRLWWNITWGLLAALAGVPMIASFISGETPIFSSLFVLVGVTGLIWNHLLGAGCEASVVTGVQTARLPALVRLKKARRILGQLQPLIEAAQADLVPGPPATPPTVNSPPPTAA